jgi:hypothetical protein
MNLLRNAQMDAWLREKNIVRRDEQGARRRLELEQGYAGLVVVEFPAKPSQILSLAGDIILLRAKHVSEFAGGVLWISTWRIWSDVADDLGEFIVTRLRAATSRLESLASASAHQLESTEWQLATALAFETAMLNWDAFFVPRSGDVIVEISHDELVWIYCRTEASLSETLSALEQWSPKRHH